MDAGGSRTHRRLELVPTGPTNGATVCAEPRRAVGDVDSRRWLDAGSRRWLTELRTRGRTGERAVGELHELLLRMAYSRLVRTRPPLRGVLLDELANEAADEAAVKVLAHLDDFRGLSRFTTWACQFAITEASVSLRRYRRRTRELPVEPLVLVRMSSVRAGCDDEVERAELLRLVCDGVANELTRRQRVIMITLVIGGESPDAVANALGTNRGALYKNLHDARRKLRAHVVEHGLTVTGGSAAAR